VAALAVIAASAASSGGGGPVPRMLPARQLTRVITKAVTPTAGASTPCWASSNWSGYALSQTSPPGLPCVPASGKTYTAVSGTWTVPAVTGGGRQSAYSAAWTGIDGFTNSSLIQAGTEQDVIKGVAHYAAWWEILPAAETVIPSITVEPGDSITVSIVQVAGTSWKITLTDNGQPGTPGHVAQPPFWTTQTYTGPGTSAEWILEAPQVGGRIATLAPYGSTNFDLGSADSASPGLVGGTSGELTQSSFFRSTVVSIASAPDTGTPAGDGFATAYGSVAPAAPTT
jgi:hypothetical protein